MPQRVVVIFSSQWTFSIFELYIYIYTHTYITGLTTIYKLGRKCD